MANGNGEEEQGQNGNGEEEAYEPPPEGQEEGQSIPRDALPEELRDLPPEQIGSATQALVRTLESRNQEVQELRQAMMSQGREEEIPEEEDVPDLSDDEFKDMILEEPEEALEYYLKKKGYAAKLRQIEELASEGARTGAYTTARQELPDFEKYEEQVQRIIESGGGAPTYANIRGAYLMARGAASLDSEMREKTRKVTSEPPSPPEEEEEEPELTPGEDRARRALGLSKEDYLRGKEGPVEVTPPGIEE